MMVLLGKVSKNGNSFRIIISNSENNYSKS